MHCVCNTVQLLQRYRRPSFLLNHAPNTAVAERIDYKTQGVIQQHEYELWVNKIEEIKQLVEFRQCTNIYSIDRKRNFRVSPFYRYTEAQVNWCGIVKCFLIAYFIGNIFAKNIKIRSYMSELYQAKGGTFFERNSWPVGL